MPGKGRPVQRVLTGQAGVFGGVVEQDEAEERDPRRWVAEALSYLGNNQSRMDYPRYRSVESMILMDIPSLSPF
jgi:hypothetical protein